MYARGQEREKRSALGPLSLFPCLIVEIINCDASVTHNRQSVNGNTVPRKGITTVDIIPDELIRLEGTRVKAFVYHNTEYIITMSGSLWQTTETTWSVMDERDGIFNATHFSSNWVDHIETRHIPWLIINLP